MLLDRCARCGWSSSTELRLEYRQDVAKARSRAMTGSSTSRPRVMSGPVVWVSVTPVLLRLCSSRRAGEPSRCSEGHEGAGRDGVASRLANPLREAGEDGTLSPG